MSAADLVIATSVPSMAGGGERLLQLARWLSARGVSVEIVALGEGTRPDLAAFRKVAPTTVVDRFRRTGLARVPHVLGLRSLTRSWKQLRLRAWLRRRQGATFLVIDPTAAALVRHSPVRPSTVIAGFPDRTWSLERLRPEDLDTLLDADGWLTADAAQTEQVRQRYAGPVVELGGAATEQLIDRNDLPPVHRDPAGAVVLLGPPGLWDAVDHSVEIAWRLHRHDPDRRLRLVADGDDDRWLAAHDAAHAGLRGVLDLVSSDDPGVLVDVAAVVRTGYAPCHSELALAAALGGVPVLGTCTSDLPGSAAPQFDELDVDGVAAALLDLLDRPGDAAAAGDRLRAAVVHLDLDHHIDAVAELLAADRD